MSVCSLSRLLRPNLVSRLYSARRLPSGCSLSSVASSHVQVSMDDKTGVAVMRLDRKPVNGLNLDLLTELVISLEKLENEKTCRGLIITSAFPKIFCAGLDIMEMYQPEEGRLREFWRAVQEVWLRFYGSRLPVMAAVNGHSPAGGCLMALCADYRIMAEGKYTIGLNETQLGIVAPFWLMDSMANTVGFRVAARSLELGQMFSPTDALALGLIDEVVPEDQVVSAAQQEITKWLAIPAHARELTKVAMRKDTVARLLAARDQDLEDFVQRTMSEVGQRCLTQYLDALKKRNKSK